MDSTRFLPTLFAAVVAGCAALHAAGERAGSGAARSRRRDAARCSSAARGVQIYECRRARRRAARLALHRARGAACSTNAAGRSAATAPGRTGRPRTAAASSARWSRRSCRAGRRRRSPGCCCTPAPAGGAGRLAGITSVQRDPHPRRHRARAPLRRGDRARPDRPRALHRRLRLLRKRSHMSERARFRRRSDRGPEPHPARQLPAGGRRLGRSSSPSCARAPTAWPRRSGAATSR